MIKKTIEYEDYNGTKRTEDFYFNLSEAEIVEMQLEVSGGLSNSLKKLVSGMDQPGIIKFFKDFVLRCYGEKSPDGRRFIKSETLRNEFSQTEAYSKLFIELALDDEKAADFINGVIPRSMVDDLNKAISEHSGS